MSNSQYIVDQSLADFLESPIAILIASCDASNCPIITRGFGARVSEDCTQVTIFITEKHSAKVLEYIRQTGRVTFNAARVTDYESYQVKGINAEQCDLSIKDERHVSDYLKGIKAEMNKVGVTPEQADNIFQSGNSSKIIGIKATVSEVFCQTPGPGAGSSREMTS